MKVVLKGSFFPWRKVKPAQLTAINSHSIQSLQALGIHYKFVVYFYKTNYILHLPFVLNFEKKWTLVELTILRYIIDGMKLQTSFLKGLQLSSEICCFLQISIFWQLPGEETAQQHLRGSVQFTEGSRCLCVHVTSTDLNRRMNLIPNFLAAEYFSVWIS